MIYAAFDFKESISRDSSRMRVNARVYCQGRNLPLFLMLLSLEVELGNPETRSVYCYYYSNDEARSRLKLISREETPKWRGIPKNDSSARAEK